MEQGTEEDLSLLLLESLESLVVMIESSDPDPPGLQGSIEDGSGVDLSQEEGVDMTTVDTSREKRPLMAVRSSNLEIQRSTTKRTTSTSRAP